MRPYRSASLFFRTGGRHDEWDCGHVVNFLKLFKKLGTATVLLACITVLYLTRRRQDVLTGTYAVIAKEIRPHQCLAHSRTLPWSLRQVSNTGMFKYINCTIRLIESVLCTGGGLAAILVCAPSSWRMMMSTTCDDESPAVDNSSNSWCLPLPIPSFSPSSSPSSVVSAEILGCTVIWSCACVYSSIDNHNKYCFSVLLSKLQP